MHTSHLNRLSNKFFLIIEYEQHDKNMK